MDYFKKYPNDEIPSIWRIDKAVRNANLQTKKPKVKKKKGGSKYLLYPIQCIRNLGYIQQSADFIGRKYIAGRTEPINIFSDSYYAPFKLYGIKRILAEKAIYVIEILRKKWRKFPIPNVFRMDNGLQFRGSAIAKKAIGMFLRFLLNLNIIPLFGSPSKPWTNPHIEGHNRVFNEKVWNTNFFKNINQIDKECRKFNEENLELFKFRYSQLIFNGKFNYLEPEQEIIIDRLITTKNKKVYFIRFVESIDRNHKAIIIILNTLIYLPEKYSHQFVFVEWDIEKEQLLIYSEFENQITLIYRVKFRLNI